MNLRGKGCLGFGLVFGWVFFFSPKDFIFQVVLKFQNAIFDSGSEEKNKSFKQLRKHAMGTVMKCSADHSSPTPLP